MPESTGLDSGSLYCETGTELSAELTGAAEVPVLGFSRSADVAQLAERGFRKAQVVGSNPTVGSSAWT